jgi:hypothetical protein
MEIEMDGTIPLAERLVAREHVPCDVAIVGGGPAGLVASLGRKSYQLLQILVPQLEASA